MYFTDFKASMCHFLSAFAQKLFIALIFITGCFAHAEDLVSSDNSIHSDKRINRVDLYLLQVTENEEMGLRRTDYISQKEQQETIRFINADQLTYQDLFEARKALRANARFQGLNTDQKNDIEKFFTDVMSVETTMNEHRIFDHMWCRFALQNNPMDEVPSNSMFKNIEQYRGLIPGPLLESLLKSQNDRAVVGFCWSKKENDWMTRTGTAAIAVLPQK